MPYPMSLPVIAPRAIDSSILSTYQRCPRKAFYSYWLGRAPVGDNYPIKFGVAYHKFREVLEVEYRNGSSPEQCYAVALKIALDGYTDPPLGHKKEYLTRARLVETCEQGFNGWLNEKDRGEYVVLETEQPFELILPSGERYGGRIDQVMRWSRSIWIRDFKTTSMMGRTYANQFDPNAQFTGYIWGTQKLSGERVKGVMVETVYNTKKIGPEHHPFLSTRTAFHIEEWIEDVERTIRDVRQCEEEEVWPKNTTACGDYGGCFFRSCCSLSSWGAREEWLESHTSESRWDFAAPDKEKVKVDR